MKYNLYSKYNIVLYDRPNPTEVLKYRVYGKDCCIESKWKIILAEMTNYWVKSHVLQLFKWCLGGLYQLSKFPILPF